MFDEKTLIELNEYNHYYNEKIIGHCKENKTAITDKTIELLNHSVAAMVIWCDRIQGKSDWPKTLWTNKDLSIIETQELQYYQKVKMILSEKNTDELITYKTSQGIHHKNQMGVILFHALNHFTYHRGQITLEFRKAGIDVIPSDYILYKLS